MAQALTARVLSKSAPEGSLNPQVQQGGVVENLTGLHHVTAVTGQARQNLEFYRQNLGLRLVKKTVNQDMTSSYHLFYGDSVGHPGTEMTFFDWPQVGANLTGAGEVAATGFIVPQAALSWWRDSFDRMSVQHGGIVERFGRSVLAFEDSEGQRLELLADGSATASSPWEASPIPAEMAIIGLASVTLAVRDLEPTSRFLEDTMGFRQAGEYPLEDGAQKGLVYHTGPGGLGAEVYLVERPNGQPAEVGIGGVHHVAFRVPDDDEHRQWHDHLARKKVHVTKLIDRYYFRSIYFREPGGVLFEIATDGPGFTSDEDVEHLGESLSLPPFLEPRRSEIEAQLEPLPTVAFP